MPKKEGKIDLKEDIKAIIRAELSVLISRISNDFKTNYGKKARNWTLQGFDKPIIAHMVFVSSYESKSGNMFQKIAREIANIKYGKENVPLIMQGRGVSDLEFEEWKKSNNPKDQVVITKVDQSDCQRFIAGFQQKNRAVGRRKERVKPTLNHDMLKEINKEEFRMTEKITSKPIDLMIYNPKEKNYYMMEIKAGGGLDSSNAPANVIKMLTEYALLGKDNVKLYFATLYNFNGEGKVWNGQVTKYLSNEMLLIGKDFWNVVLPDRISFEILAELYKDVAEELNVNEKINALITEVKQ